MPVTVTTSTCNASAQAGRPAAKRGGVTTSSSARARIRQAPVIYACMAKRVGGRDGTVRTCALFGHQLAQYTAAILRTALNAREILILTCGTAKPVVYPRPARERETRSVTRTRSGAEKVHCSKQGRANIGTYGRPTMLLTVVATDAVASLSW